jgi:dienelactone hydrolase
MTAMAPSALEQRIDALMRHAEIFRPEGPGPFPVVAQFHGCGGKKDFQTGWAEAARASGVAAIVVDSFAHRGIKAIAANCMVCTGAKLHGRERAGDVFAALEWARRQDWIDKSRMAIAGWSHGGWAALEALSLRPGREMARATGLRDLPEEPLAGVRGAFLVYPYVGVGFRGKRQGLRYDARPMALVGAVDRNVGSHSSRRALTSLRTAGAPVRIKWMEDCTHAFDEPRAPALFVRHNEAQTTYARTIYTDYLREVFALAGEG